jgi:hypothetical protein
MAMKYSIIIVALFLCLTSNGQTFRSESSEVSFFSTAPLEDISAVNRDGSGIFDAEANKLAFLIPIQGFQFRKSLMQRHFNERFMNSDLYPNATFKGEVLDMDPDQYGKQQVRAQGDLTIRGVTRPVVIEGELTNLGKRVEMEAEFPVRLEDYDISIPKILFRNIAEIVDVKARFRFTADD